VAKSLANARESQNNFRINYCAPRVRRAVVLDAFPGRRANSSVAIAAKFSTAFSQFFEFFDLTFGGRRYRNAGILAVPTAVRRSTTIVAI
jgi:hypothetical protein